MVWAGKTLLSDATSMGMCTSHLSRAAGEVGRGSGREGAVMKHGKLCKSRLLVTHPLPALRGNSECTEDELCRDQCPTMQSPHGLE